MEVQIKNISDKKLKKDYEIVVPYQIIETKVNESITKIRKTLSIKGFRKGQVPVDVIKEKYGKSIMAEESDKLISEQVKKIIIDNDLKVAMQPKIDVKNFDEGKDLEISASFEIFPEIPEIDVQKIKITKREAEIDDLDIKEGIEKLLKFFRKWDKQEGSYKAKNGDAVNIDYVGKIDKEEFAGGSAKGHQLELGSKSFIDNFEEQLIGKKAGDEVKVKVKFPKEYHSEEFAGKKAEFDVKINEVLTSKLPEINDEFIKENFGIENEEKLKEAVEKQIKDNYDSLSRDMFKKELFDFLDKKYDFDLPEGIVEEQLKSLMKDEKDQEDKKIEKEKKKTAQRMIRCGLILNDLAQKNKVEASNEDINNELQKIMQRFAGQEKAIIEHYQKNPSAIQQLKGSVIEEKTVDFIIKTAQIESKKISLKDFDKLWEKMNKE
jgi:trigger factor